jgi:phospholipase C
MCRHRTALLVASIAFTPALGSCGGGGRGAAPPVPSGTTSPSVSFALSSASATTHDLPPSGGYTGTVSFRRAPATGGATVSMTSSAGGQNALYTITFTPQVTVVLAGLPQFTLTLPPSVKTANERFFYVVSVSEGSDSQFPLTVGPASVSGQQLTFAGTNTPVTFTAGQHYIFTFYQQQATAAGTIQHVVIIIQENRTPDNLFHGLPGADTVQSGQNSRGETVALHPVDMTAPYDLDHSHHGFLTEYDNGNLDGFDKVGSSLCSTCAAPSVRAYGFVPQSQTQPYWTMAEQYTFADRMFQTNEGPSFPAHQYIISGTSEPSAGSSLLAAENPTTPSGSTTGGCDSPAGSLVAMIDPSGSEATKEYPCFDHPTLMDALDEKQQRWRYYEAYKGPGLWTAPDAIAHIRSGADYANVVAPSSTIFNDIANLQLPAVSWVIPTAAESDHAKSTDGSGPSWVASIVNAVGESPYWNSTAIFITWDDWGGWYDHVKPQSYNTYELGFRVPLIVVSPYAKHAYVSHVQHEFGSILKFTEETFGLPSLNYTDLRADDLVDCFDFGQQPSPFHAIAAPIGAAAFLHQPVSTTIPDDDF